MLDKEREAKRLAKVYKKKQIKNVKIREFQLSAKGIKNERGHQWLSFKNIHASGWQDMFILNYYRLLYLYNVTGNCVQKKNSNG
jgi:hypothetical protein